MVDSVREVPRDWGCVGRVVFNIRKLTNPIRGYLDRPCLMISRSRGEEDRSKKSINDGKSGLSHFCSAHH